MTSQNHLKSSRFWNHQPFFHHFLDHLLSPNTHFHAHRLCKTKPSWRGFEGLGSCWKSGSDRIPPQGTRFSAHGGELGVPWRMAGWWQLGAPDMGNLDMGNFGLKNPWENRNASDIFQPSSDIPSIHLLQEIAGWCSQLGDDMGSLGHSTCGSHRWWLTRLRLLCILDGQFHCAECAMLSASSNCGAPGNLTAVFSYSSLWYRQFQQRHGKWHFFAHDLWSFSMG